MAENNTNSSSPSLAEVRTLNGAHSGRNPPKLTLCVPTWKDNCKELMRSLCNINSADQCALVIYDDGSNDPELTESIRQMIQHYPGPATLITASQNRGRSWARNRLMEEAHTQWLIFIDADMRPDVSDYLDRYLKVIQTQQDPALTVGGFSLKHAKLTPQTRLHAEQARLSECLPASQRAKAPGRYVFSSNILVHRRILNDIQFDPAFKGWGWEDVDWGLRIARAYPVQHIENTATHLGLDTDSVLLRKYRKSAANFARTLMKNQRDLKQTSLYRMVKLLTPLPGKSLLQDLTEFIARAKFLPIRLRVFGLKLYRAAVYAEYV